MCNLNSFGEHVGCSMYMGIHLSLVVESDHACCKMYCLSAMTTYEIKNIICLGSLLDVELSA